ncbi:MAG TPA: class I SAM-dependent methyltransferase [Casimicrobiaceae bacterium]|nr:class I SAM-dependent methyltransferase [Casimicrobiaceae bacterium]
MPTTYDDEFYRDILEGLAIYTGSALQRDVLRALSASQAPGIGEALNKNQIASKMWLAQSLFDSVGGRLGQVLILGGWVGVLGAVLLHDRRFSIDRVVSVDVDSSCAPVAQALNATHVETARFVAMTRDMLAIDYAREFPASTAGATDVIVNTSCEHLADFDEWFARIPPGRLLVLQSNDYFACAEHVACVPDLATFRSQAPLANILFAGERKLSRYTRFMLIGMK